jgi:hypothetical protein
MNYGSIRLSKLFQVCLLLPLVVSLVSFATIPAYAAQVTLSWDANSDPTLASYRVHYGTQSRNYSQSLDVGNQTTCTVSDLQDGITYYFAATAYSSGEESDYSNEVSYFTPVGCSYFLSPTSQSFSASAGAGRTTVTTQTGCTWTASTGTSWMSITSGTSGRGNGTVAYALAANTTTSSRTAVTTIAGRLFTVTQAGTTNFTVAATAGIGGSISPSGSVTVAYGTSRTFAISPASGYNVYRVTVDGYSVGTVKSYTFTNVKTNHTITATFRR